VTNAAGSPAGHSTASATSSGRPSLPSAAARPNPHGEAPAVFRRQRPDGFGLDHPEREQVEPEATRPDSFASDRYSPAFVAV
jgi:hypothetical protein